MKEIVYFGTYTRRTSQGIYKADFDAETGQLSNLVLFASEPSPTYLAFDQHQHLYTVGSQDDKGGIAAYQTDGTLLNHVVEEGAPHCYVAVDEKRNLVYAANYHKGQVLVYKRQENGRLLLSDVDQHSGQGPHENQASPHVHYTDLTPDHYLVTCDLGTDQVITYNLDAEGKLSKLYTYHSQPGAGSRHIIFHNHYKIAYLICELNSTIEVLIYDGVGEFERMQVISTLPEGYEGFNATAAIRLSKDGKYLYASNRDHDSIAVYTILADGSLELLEIVPTHGQTPRDFDLTPDQEFVIAVHQDSDNATVFKRNPETGRLAELSNDFHVPEAVCISFAPWGDIKNELGNSSSFFSYSLFPTLIRLMARCSAIFARRSWSIKCLSCASSISRSARSLARSARLTSISRARSAESATIVTTPLATSITPPFTAIQFT